MRDRDQFIFHLLSGFSVTRYLLCNTRGREDGYEKAEAHKEMCQNFIAMTFMCEPDIAWDFERKHITRKFGDHKDHNYTFGEGLYDFVHDHTQKLTSHLDTIGMPTELGVMPDYEKLVPIFEERFFALATEATAMWKASVEI